MTSLEQRTTRYLDWIDPEIDYVRTYHDQKERSAWTATAFYELLSGAEVREVEISA